ncbi:MAG: type IV pilus secretin PilQ [candidate division Zixibacteria bacterium]|nr:type IV pilus secretin PilQ [candidate division Zixibacteria bacterium]
MVKTRLHKLIYIGLMVVLATSVTVSFGDTTDPATPIKNLNFQAADIRSVIRFLADYGRVNVVVAPTVEGNVTIALNDVTWKQALEIIGKTYDLAVVFEEGSYIRVLPAADYRKEVTEEKKALNEQENLVGLDTRVINISNSTATGIVDAVKSLLTTRGKVSADNGTNSIILQEVPGNIDKVIKFIAQLDRPPRQIRISAQLLEVSSNNLTELGIDWTVNGATGGDVVDPVSGATIRETQHTTSQTLEEGRMTDRAGSFSITTIQSGWDLEARISALVSKGKGKIIAHPEITTVDNSEAKIQAGQKVPIKQFDESGNTVIKFEEVGTLLKVTPHITSENRILMKLLPERSTYEYDANGVIINTNNAVTNVVVENGQTAVIGGLTTQDETESKVGIPILMDIPVIGNLFSYTRKKIDNRDLVIFVTPTIVDNLASATTETTVP